MKLQRTFRLNLRLSAKEWKKVNQLFANSTCRSLSEYARKLLTEQPIHQFFRNPPLEELNRLLMPLLEYLTAVANAVAQGDPKSVETSGYMMEVAEDIRTYLAKLAPLCDLK